MLILKYQIWWNLVPNQNKPDLSGAADDGKEHSVEIEIPEISRNLHSVEEERDDRNGQVESDADVVALLDVGNVDARDDEGAAAAGPEVSAVEAEGVEVVADSVSSPLFTTSGVRNISKKYIKSFSLGK